MFFGKGCEVISLPLNSKNFLIYTFSKNLYSQMLRKINLENLFGKSFICK
jgi:hypothetical protein